MLDVLHSWTIDGFFLLVTIDEDLVAERALRGRFLDLLRRATEIDAAHPVVDADEQAMKTTFRNELYKDEKFQKRSR